MPADSGPDDGSFVGRLDDMEYAFEAEERTMADEVLPMTAPRLLDDEDDAMTRVPADEEATVEPESVSGMMPLRRLAMY